MTAIWHYFWPVYAACLVIGFLAGAAAFLRPTFGDEPARPLIRIPGLANRRLVIAAGAALALVVAMLWYFPLGAAERFSGRLETIVRITLDYYELPMVRARLERRPLTRHLVLSGPADDFQRRELVRIMDEVPGVSEVSWDPSSLPAELSR